MNKSAIAACFLVRRVSFRSFVILTTLMCVCVCVCVRVLSCSVVSNSVVSWTVTCQAPLSIRFPREECWSGFPWPSPGDLPNPGIEPASPALQTNSLPTEPFGKPLYDP